jgi:multidrug resistance efflux pump
VDLPPAQARVAEAQAQLDDATRQLARAESGGSVFSSETIDLRRSAVAVASARRDSARAELARLAAGTWAPDLAAAAARVAQAEAAVAQARAEVERLTVRAPVAGTVLQVKVRAGEFAPAGVLATPLMLLGDTATLQVRVDVDENDAWRIAPGAKAKATVRGNASIGTDLTWVRAEPYIVPKRSLTGDSSERVDTRVLQVVYRFPRGDLPVYVGQQMDVYIETAKP